MDKFVQLPFVIPRAEPSQLDNYVRKLFLQDKIQNRDVKQMQVNEAAKEVAREIIKESAKEDGKVEAGQSMKNAPEIDQITKIVAEKHGLGTDQDQELLKDQVEERMNVQNLNRKINSFSYEDPQIRKIILDIAPEFSGNPREVKRFMNVFRFHYFLLSARQTQDPNIPSIEQLSRWILLSLKWPTVSRWLQGNVQALEKLEEFGRSCNNYVDWLKKIEADLRLKPDTFPDIFGEGVFFFFRREGNEIKEKEERLSSSSGKGMY
jgi:hypothetical protein